VEKRNAAVDDDEEDAVDGDVAVDEDAVGGGGRGERDADGRAGDVVLEKGRRGTRASVQLDLQDCSVICGTRRARRDRVKMVNCVWTSTADAATPVSFSKLLNASENANSSSPWHPALYSSNKFVLK